MGKKPSKKPDKVPDNMAKARILETVVAMMHDYSGVKVEKNVELPAKHATKGRTREVDVLLTSTVADYPVRIAIACRNEATKVEVGDIGEFVDLLDDVGIPPQQGIFVSVKGFRKGALDRAKDIGIRTLVLEGLTKDRLAAAVEKAFQFFVYLLPEVTQIRVRNELPRADLAFVFSEENQRYCGDVLDLVVSRWRQGEIPPTLGEYELDLQVPEGWLQFWKSKPVNVLSISVSVRIIGYVFELVGESKKFTLIDAEKKKPEKVRLQAAFNATQKLKEAFEVRTAQTEEQLNQFLHGDSGVRIIQRIRLPRVLSGACFHPISKRVKDLMLADTQSLSWDELKKLPPLTLEEVEETVNGSIHEMPWRWFPVIINEGNGHLVDVQLLMRNGEYRKVAALAALLKKYPTPEFAQLVTAAHQMVSAEITGSILGKAPIS
jgi:hypothetical protein